MRSGPAPTLGCALAVAAAGAAAFVLPEPVTVLLLMVIVAATVADAALVRTAPAVSRQLPALLSRGVPAPIGLGCDDARAQVVQAGPPGVLVEHEPGAAVVTALRRGRFVLPAPWVRRRGPLHLACWWHVVGQEAVLRAYPDLVTARRSAAVVRATVAAPTGATVRGPLGLGTDFEALREYRLDDDVRLVNWRATARLQRPVSNTYRVEQSRRVVLALDCGRLMATPADRWPTRLDLAVDAAAAVALAAHRSGDRLGLLTFDETVRSYLRPNPGPDSLRQVLRGLADAECRLVDADPEALVLTLPRGERADVMIFTDLLDPASTASLRACLPALAARHGVTVVAVTEEDALLAPATGGGGRWADAARVLAALDLLQDQRAAVTALRRAGAQLVLAQPGRLVAAAVAAAAAGRGRAA